MAQLLEDGLWPVQMAQTHLVHGLLALQTSVALSRLLTVALAQQQRLMHELRLDLVLFQPFRLLITPTGLALF
mgnify:CR=1 FL=1